MEDQKVSGPPYKAIAIFIVAIITLLSLGVWNIERRSEERIQKYDLVKAENDRQIAVCETSGGKALFTSNDLGDIRMPIRTADGDIACMMD